MVVVVLTRKRSLPKQTRQPHRSLDVEASLGGHVIKSARSPDVEPASPRPNPRQTHYPAIA